MKYTGSERRRFPRLEIPLLVLYRPETDDPFVMFKAICRNISGQGLMFEREKPLPIGSRLCLEIYQPSIRYKDLIFLVACQAKVIWVGEKKGLAMKTGTNKYQIGIEFTKIEEKDRDRIIGYIEKTRKGW